MKKIVAGLTLATFLFLLAPVAVLGVEIIFGNGNGAAQGPEGITIAQDADDVYQTISAIIDWMFYIIMFGVAIMIAIAAFSFLTAAGDPEKTSKARNYIVYALVGAVVGFLAKGIMMIVATALGVEDATFW